MKKIILSIIIIVGAITTNAQNATESISKNTDENASVEKSIFGLQLSLLGLWMHNEARLSNALVLRTEVGLYTELSGGDFYDKTYVTLTPVIKLEPRYYYNLKKRLKKSRRIDGNSGNFISLSTSYYPGWVVYSNIEDLSISSNLNILPTWGIRRNIGNHVNYEVGLGIGPNFQFYKINSFTMSETNLIAQIHLRIGYRFANK